MRVEQGPVGNSERGEIENVMPTRCLSVVGCVDRLGQPLEIA